MYTAQGFEYSWNGVIFAPDLVWSVKTVDDGTFDRLVRHVYKVLLTRGMVGTILFSTDPETRAKLRQLTSGTRTAPI
ncbi:DNA/RNA helicase domain-containing protein [Cellulomonas sp. Leaf334]|uniref:DNA/RNA helicase domain-containing protein n=1 Tax=Cellulomonas sp. Leaf334 TaxID=1736339 RepID=UPI0006F8D6C3|nr:hypothetical protein ASF78_17250 [Cellulomonas sp. Leaf334]